MGLSEEQRRCATPFHHTSFQDFSGFLGILTVLHISWMSIQARPIFQFMVISCMGSNGISGIEMFIAWTVIVPLVAFVNVGVEITIYKCNGHFPVNFCGTCSFRNIMQIFISQATGCFQVGIL